MICCLTVNLYNNQLILHIQYMHALPAPFPEDDTVQKRPFLFLVCVFSRNKAVHVDYFDFKVCGYAFFLISELCYGRDVQWLQQYIGHYGLYHTELAMDSVTLTVCDKCGSVADQNVTVFQSYEDEKL